MDKFSVVRFGFYNYASIQEVVDRMRAAAREGTMQAFMEIVADLEAADEKYSPRVPTRLFAEKNYGEA